MHYIKISEGLIHLLSYQKQWDTKLLQIALLMHFMGHLSSSILAHPPQYENYICISI